MNVAKTQNAPTKEASKVKFENRHIHKLLHMLRTSAAITKQHSNIKITLVIAYTYKKHTRTPRSRMYSLYESVASIRKHPYDL